ncbi:porin family protein [Porticoccaceae bacterium]|nr:porin family protein [Porticoccaceae bacterium]
MFSINKRLFALILLSSSVTPTAVFAENYMGLAVGRTDTSVAPDGNDVTEDGTSLEIRAGRSLHDIFAVEVGYIDFGDMGFAQGLAEGEISGDAFELTIVAHYPVNDRLNLLASVGVSDWDTSLGGADYESSYKDNGTNLVLGVGIDYRLNDKFSVDLKYKDYDIGALDKDLGMDCIALGIKLSFK